MVDGASGSVTDDAASWAVDAAAAARSAVIVARVLFILPFFGGSEVTAVTPGLGLDDGITYVVEVDNRLPELFVVPPELANGTPGAVDGAGPFALPVAGGILGAVGGSLLTGPELLFPERFVCSLWLALAGATLGPVDGKGCTGVAHLLPWTVVGTLVPACDTPDGVNNAG